MRMLRVGRWITAIGLVLLAGVYLRALSFTPIEQSQGLAQKIFYLHVPAAIWAELAMILVGVSSIFFLFVGYLLLRSAVPDPAMRARYAAVLGICGMCEVPFIHLSVYMFPTLHPMPIVLQPGRPKLPGDMLTTWLLSLGVFTLLYVGFVVQRYALSYLREQLEAVGEVGGGHA